MDASNPTYDAAGTIDLIVDHPVFGLIPFTASPDDTEEHGRDLFARAVAGEFGAIAPYVAPPVPIPSACSRRQGRLALLGAGKLDTAEAAIAAILDPVAKRQAQIEYEADTWDRANPFLQSMWASLGGTPEELDALYSLAVTL